jgi:sugar lactone lactonase YvrE
MIWKTVISEPSALGESPFWHPHEQMLYWVDIAGFQIKRANTFMDTVESWPIQVDGQPVEPGCMAPAKSGGLVIALRDRMVRARTWGGTLETLQVFNHDPATTRFNDGKCDPLGRFWAGTMFEPRTARSAELFSLDARYQDCVLGRHATARYLRLGLRPSQQCHDLPTRVQAVCTEARRLAAFSA